MGIHIIHRICGDTGIVHGQAHGFSTTDSAWGWRGDVVGIAGHPVADHFAKNVGATGFGVLQGFQHQNAGPFADHKAVTFFVELSTGGRGIVIAE